MARPVRLNANGERIEVRYTASTVADPDDPTKKVLYITDHDTGMDWIEDLTGWELVFPATSMESVYYRKVTPTRAVMYYVT